MRRRLNYDSGRSSINPSLAEATDVVFYDGTDLVIRRQGDWVDGETPVGIVVVPGSHNRYGDGSCGVMSLQILDRTGVAAPQAIRCAFPVLGPDSVDDESYGSNLNVGEEYDMLINYGASCWSKYASDSASFKSTTSITSTSVYIPCQKSANSDEVYFYNSSNTVNWPYVSLSASEITDAGSEEYKNNGTYPYLSSRSGKAACDFNGLRNTALIYVADRYVAYYTTANLTNQNIMDYREGAVGSGSPVNIVASRYKTVGTRSLVEVYTGVTANDYTFGTPVSPKDNKGVWYLPALGELSYLPSKRFKINKTILALNQKYGNVASQLATAGHYVSSSVRDADYVWLVNTAGNFLTYDKYQPFMARVFMRL